MGQHLPGRGHPARRVGFDVVRVAADEQLRTAGHPRVIRRDVIGHVVQDQPWATRRQGGPRHGQGIGAAEAGIDDVASYAVRRPDDIGVPQVRERLSERGLQLSTGVRSPSPAGLRPQTPIGQTASTPAGTAASQSAAPIAAKVTGCPGQLVQPYRGVDLVDHRLVRPPGHRAALICCPAAALLVAFRPRVRSPSALMPALLSVWKY